MTAKLHKGRCVWDKCCQHGYRPFRADQSPGFLKPEPPGSMQIEPGFAKKAGQTMGMERWDGSQGQECEPRTSGALPICTDFRPPEGLGGTVRRERPAQELRRLNACSPKPPLFAPRSCLTWWLQALGAAAEAFRAGNAWQALE